MRLGEKVKEVLITRAADGLGLSVGVVLAWVYSEVGPAMLPALESSISKSELLKITLASFALNIIFLAIFWLTRKKSEFKLKYGIYWDLDKNPHCPACKIPTGAYNEYQTGWGYYCKPCEKIFPLTDAAGNDIKPTQVLAEL